MATNVTFEAFTPAQNNGGQGGKVSGVISLADVLVRNITNPLAITNDTVTADLQRTIVVTAAQGVTAGIPPGCYEKSDGVIFRKTGV